MIRHVDRAINHVADGFELLGGEMRREPVKDECLRLAALAFNALRWAREQLLKGYYGLSIASSRLAFDAWLNGVYLNYYPEKLPDWQRFKTRPKPAVMRKLVMARSGLEPADAEEWRRALSQFYVGDESEKSAGLSGFSHATRDSINLLIGAAPDGGLVLRVGPDFDENQLRMAAHDFCVVAHLAAFLFLFLADDPAEYAKEHAQVFEDYFEYSSSFIASLGDVNQPA